MTITKLVISCTQVVQHNREIKLKKQTVVGFDDVEGKYTITTTFLPEQFRLCAHCTLQQIIEVTM